MATEDRFSELPGVMGVLYALILVFSAQLAGVLLYQVGLGLLSGVGVGSGTTTAQILTTVLFSGSFALVVLVFVNGVGDRDLFDVSVPSGFELALAAGSVVVLFVLQTGIVWLIAQFDLAPVTNRAIDPTTHTPTYFLLMVLVSLLVVGPAEELLFRGAIQGLFRRAWGMWPAILAASLMFGSVHFLVGSGTFAERGAYVAIAFLLGIGLGYLYEYTGNLTVPALAHGGYNAVAFGLQYLDSVGLLG